MSGTSAASVFHVEDWDRELLRAGDASSSSSSGDFQALDGALALTQIAEFPPVDLSRRSLTNALAEIGPGQPAPQSNAEPWSRAELPVAQDSTSMFAMAHGASFEPAAAHMDIDGIPPPPRPFRQAPFLTAEDELAASGQSIPHGASNFAPMNFGEIDVSGVELVRLLAEADLAREQQARETFVHHASDADMMGPAPIIIERARAEKELGVLPALPPVPWANPVHGLLAGFSLSLVTGAVIYVMLVGG